MEVRIADHIGSRHHFNQKQLRAVIDECLEYGGVITYASRRWDPVALGPNLAH